MTAHVTAVLSLGAGAVSFTHIVKAAEPVFTAGFSAALLGQTFALPVYLSLLPIIFGVSLASLKELSFSWIAFGNAMGSNTASALRGIMGKKQMGKPVGENMTPANLYAVLTILAFCFLSPVALLVEGRKFKPAWDAAIAAGATSKGLGSTVVLSGLFYYLYNEVAFLALDSVNPVTVRETEASGEREGRMGCFERDGLLMSTYYIGIHLSDESWPRCIVFVNNATNNAAAVAMLLIFLGLPDFLRVHNSSVRTVWILLLLLPGTRRLTACCAVALVAATQNGGPSVAIFKKTQRKASSCTAVADST